MSDKERINARIDEIHEYVKRNFDKINLIHDNKYKTICLFSLTECFVQEYCKYEKRNSENFANFISSFVSIKDRCLLANIDPITLFYRNKHELLAKNISLSYLQDDYHYNWEQMSTFSESKMILSACDNKQKEKHTYLNLIYKYRSKLSHENAAPAFMFDSMYYEEKPFYYHISDLFDTTDNGKWNLVFPYIFLKNIFSNAITNFLEQRRNLDLDPFEYKKVYYHWYE